MTELFSAKWMQSFKDKWNTEPELAHELEKIGFDSVIGYGFDGEDAPRAVVKIHNGHVVEAGDYAGEDLNWDLRASEESWKKWLKNPPGMVGLGMAYTARKLKFKVGDYTAMIKDPRMAGPFIKSFTAMSKTE